MLIQHEDWIEVVPDRLLEKSPSAGHVYVGHGLRGYVRACVDAFAAGGDVSFVRTEVKQHGLKERREGARATAPGTTAQASESIYTDEPIAMPPAHTAQGRHTPAVDRAKPATVLGRTDGADAIERAKSSVYNAVRVHTGQFRLSGGGVATRYVDTIPAITAFPALSAISALIAPLCCRPACIVAPPYGAVSLGVFLGMHWQTSVLIPLRNDSRSMHLVESLNRQADSAPAGRRYARAKILIVDDYYSTGSTIARVLAGLRAPNEVFAVCRKPDSMPVLGRITSLLVDHGGELRWSDEWQHAANAASDTAIPVV
jgi:orotate phosphoribosyltransferase